MDRSPDEPPAPSLTSRATAGSGRASPPKRGARRRKATSGATAPGYRASRSSRLRAAKRQVGKTAEQSHSAKSQRFQGADPPADLRGARRVRPTDPGRIGRTNPRQKHQGFQCANLQDEPPRAGNGHAHAPRRVLAESGIPKWQNVTAQVWVSSDLEFPQQDFGLLHEGGNEVPALLSSG